MYIGKKIGCSLCLSIQKLKASIVIPYSSRSSVVVEDFSESVYDPRANCVSPETEGTITFSDNSLNNRVIGHLLCRMGRKRRLEK